MHLDSYIDGLNKTITEGMSINVYLVYLRSSNELSESHLTVTFHCFYNFLSLDRVTQSTFSFMSLLPSEILSYISNSKRSLMAISW